MPDNKEIFFCPECNHEKEVYIPARFKCSRCGCKFIVDENGRMTSVEMIDGKIVEVFRPNKIPFRTRLYLLVVSILLMVYGIFGLSIDDIFIPGKRSRGIHFHGTAAIVVFISFLFAVACLVSVIIDHYDKRDNEINYRFFSKITIYGGLICFFISIVLQIIQDNAY